MHWPRRTAPVTAKRCTGTRTAVHRAEAEAVHWAKHRQAVEDAIWAGNNAALNYLQDKAGYTRVGHHGGAAGRWADTHDWTIASFFQHDSRDHDPQLHIHNAILNRVQGPDGSGARSTGRRCTATSPRPARSASG